MRRPLALLVLLAVGSAFAWGVFARVLQLRPTGPLAGDARAAVPVDVAAVERGRLTLLRTFTGTLEAAAEFVVAPKVAGRLKRVEVDLGDSVRRGQVVAFVDDEEFVEAVNQAEADLAVAQASQAEAIAALEIAERVLRRIESLREGGVTSESQLDAAKADELASRSHVEVTRAQLARSQAMLQSARIRLEGTRVTADWSGGDETRVVAERYVDEGGAVSPSTALLRIVELDPVVGVLQVPERDYARLAPGQEAQLRLDAYPELAFAGRVVRVAPIFRNSTRQARVELEVPNADERLKPGMFMRATLELGHVDDALSVPFDALTLRGEEQGVFVLEADGAGQRVRWCPVTVGLREGSRVEVRGELVGELVGERVVVLGQELCDDGSAVVTPDSAER